MSLSVPTGSTVELDVSAMLPQLRAVAARTVWQRSVRLVRDPRELDALAPDWNALAGGHASPLQRVEWAQSCVATLLPPGARGLRLVSVRRGGQLVAIAPLVARRLWAWSRLEQAGLAEIPEPQDLLYADETALRVLLRVLLRQPEALALERLPEQSLVPRIIEGVAGRRALVRVCEQGDYPTLVLDRDPDAMLNAGRRSDMRRALRHAERHGPVRFEVRAPGPEQVDALYAQVMQVEAASWKGRCGTALRFDGRLRDFFGDYAARAARAGILRIALMYIGAEVAAVQYAVECGQAWWLFKIGYDARFADCSPGQLLMQHTLRHAYASGLQRYELQGNSAQWTRLWGCQEHHSYAVRVHGWRPAALMAAGAQVLRRLSRRRA